MYLPLIMMRLVAYRTGREVVVSYGEVRLADFIEASKDLEKLLNLMEALTPAEREVPHLKRILELAKKLGNFK